LASQKRKFDLDLTRTVLEGTKSTCLRVIWREEVEPRLPGIAKPDAVASEYTNSVLSDEICEAPDKKPPKQSAIRPTSPFLRQTPRR
jgi:hypothetical protein